MRFRLYRRVAFAATIVMTALLPFAATPIIGPVGTARADTTASAEVPQHIGFLVADIDSAAAELASGLGTRFAPASVTTVSVTMAGETKPRSVVLRRTHSVDGSPVLTFEQASPAIGPWAAGGSAFLSYAAPDLDAAGKHLAGSGFTLVAESDDFTFWRGVGGVLVRLIDPASLAAPGPVDASGLGSIRSFTLVACDVDGLKRQLTDAFGIRWKMPMPVPLPWQYADGVVRPLVHEVHSSAKRSPHLSIETPDPDPIAQQCTPTSTPVHLVYFTSDVSAAEHRLAASGMTFIARVPFMATYFRSATGLYIEVGSTSFELAEYMP